MYPSKPLESNYVPLSPEADGTVEDEYSYSWKERRRTRAWNFISVTAMALICFAVGITGGFTLSVWKRNYGSPPGLALSTNRTRCQASPVRLEWRSLSMHEKHDYIDAVNCLRRRPSRLGQDQSLYDDFPYTHARIGAYSHHSAAFLAWHRYFLHIYEQALRQECHYSGHLTFWDWTMDWEDLAHAPVWSSTHGFGGSGNPNASDEILEGYCVTAGPFANLSVKYIKEDLKPHCLSRGFLPGPELRKTGTRYRPAKLDTILQSPDYDAFNLGLEEGPHNAIPNSIRGDFSMFTAPADPVFFLHHTQLDRLWWRWQGLNGSSHKWEYLGLAAHESEDRASLDDVLPIGGLAPDIRVSEIMDTESGLLCYRY